MVHLWGYFLAVAAAFLAIALLVGLSTLGHNHFTGAVYQGVFAQGFVDYVQLGADAGVIQGYPVGDSTTASKQRAVIDDLLHDARQWAHSVHCEVTVWSIVVLVLLVVVLGVHFWREAWPGLGM